MSLVINDHDTSLPHKLHFAFKEITLPSGTIGAFVAAGTPFAFHLAPDKEHYRITYIPAGATLDIDLDHYQECKEAIALFCEVRKVRLS